MFLRVGVLGGISFPRAIYPGYTSQYRIFCDDRHRPIKHFPLLTTVPLGNHSQPIPAAPTVIPSSMPGQIEDRNPCLQQETVMQAVISLQIVICQVQLFPTQHIN